MCLPSSMLLVRRLYVTKDGSPTCHPASLSYGASTPRLKQVAARCGKGRSRLSLGCWPGPRQGASRCRRHAGMPSRPGLHSGQAARASLACRESWRGHGCALGCMAATFQRKQFPRRCQVLGRMELLPIACLRELALLLTEGLERIGHGFSAGNNAAGYAGLLRYFVKRIVMFQLFHNYLFCRYFAFN